MPPLGGQLQPNSTSGTGYGGNNENDRTKLLQGRKEAAQKESIRDASTLQ